MRLKQCPKCGTKNHIRVQHCIQCKHVFYISKPRNKHTKPKFRFTKTMLLESFDEITYEPNEQRLSNKYYSDALRSWRSKDGKYIIRYTPIVYGVDISKSLGAYRLLANHNGMFELLTIKVNPEWSYFFNIKTAFMYYLSTIQNNGQIVRRKQRKILRKRKSR